MNNNFIDISLPLIADLPKWPGTPDFYLERFLDMENGDSCNNSRIECDVHSGTHIDAPLHFFQNAKSIDQIDLELLIGKVYVAYLPKIDIITEEILNSLQINDGIIRIFFRTKNSEIWLKRKCEFYENYVALSPDGAQWLVNKGIKLVGIDYLSIQRFNDTNSITHKILLGNEVIIIEGLNLCEIDEGMYELICLPLNIVGSDGAPARVVLKKI
jgi:arylformamidase